MVQFLVSLLLVMSFTTHAMGGGCLGGGEEEDLCELQNRYYKDINESASGDTVTFHPARNIIIALNTRIVQGRPVTTKVVRDLRNCTWMTSAEIQGQMYFPVEGMIVARLVRRIEASQISSMPRSQVSHMPSDAPGFPDFPHHKESH